MVLAVGFWDVWFAFHFLGKSRGVPVHDTYVYHNLQELSNDDNEYTHVCIPIDTEEHGNVYSGDSIGEDDTGKYIDISMTS